MFKDGSLILEEKEYFVVGVFYCHYEEIARFQEFREAEEFLNTILKDVDTCMAYFIVEY